MDALARYFKIGERGSTLSTELMAGLTTFLTMAYIIAVNPSLLSAAGVPFSAALTATCFGAAIMTIIMGLVANRPIALASGMGINAIVAFALVLGLGVDWRVAMSIIFIEGVVIIILVACGLRQAIMNAIPVNLRRAIGIGIGLFIAFIGLVGSGIVSNDEATLISMGDMTNPVVILGVISVVLAIVLTALKVKGGLLWSIIACTIIGIPMGVTKIPTDWSFGLDFSTFAAPFQNTPAGGMALIQVFLQPSLLVFAFAILMSDFFDTMGTIVAVGQQAEFVDKDGNVEDVSKILMVDSAAAAVGGFMGASSITTYIESGSGAAAGGRTGLTSVVTGLLFVVFAFLSPIVGMVSSSATCGALVVVGYLMMTDINKIGWDDVADAFPAFITIIGIPMTYSITNGIGLGFISFCIIKCIQGKFKDIHPLMWIAALAFLVTFIFT